MTHSCVCTLVCLQTLVLFYGGKMKSISSSRGLFGRTRSLFTAAFLIGVAALVRGASAQDTIEAHAGTPTSLRELVQEAQEKNPQIAASFHSWQAARNVPKQASAFPET